MNREQMLEERVATLERQLAMGPTMRRARSVRKRSEATILGMPLYDIAMGPNFETGEIRGHARGFIAVGDIATGVLAMGGVARGVVAFGGGGVLREHMVGGEAVLYAIVFSAVLFGDSFTRMTR